MKDVIKDAENKRKIVSQNHGKDTTLPTTTGNIRSRTIPPSVVDHFASKIESLQSHIKEILSAEVVAKIDRIAEIEALRAKNIIEHFDEIQSKPAREWHLSKDIRNETKVPTHHDVSSKSNHMSEAGTGTHRMTRKKRRMNELRKRMASENASNKEEDNDEGTSNVIHRQSKLMSETSIKASARAQKRDFLEKLQSKEEMSIYEESKEKQRKHKKSKGERDSLGSGGLFQDELITHKQKARTTSNDKKETNAVPSTYFFRGYDPNKTNVKGKKKSVHSFKSKSKFKRRK